MENKTKNLTIRVPEKLHHAFKRIIAAKGLSMTEILLETITKVVKEGKNAKTKE